MTITLPDDVRAEAKAAAAGHPDVASYVADLIRADPDDSAVELANDELPELVVRDRADLEAKLLAALDSGPAVRVTPEFWIDLRRRVADRVAALRGQP